MGHKRYREEKNCLNCGQEVHGKFCPNCGQENVELRDNFFSLAGHFISDYFHFDSKFFKSLFPLFVKPGFLTKEYWEGRRKRYIPPVRLFFFVTILFMLFTSHFYHRYGDRVRNEMVKGDATVGGYDSTQIFAMHDTARVLIHHRQEVITGKELKQEYVDNVVEFNQFHASVDFVFHNLKYVTFFLLPVYALFFKLFYFRRRPYYIDHVIYAMHLQTFLYLMLCLLFGLSVLFPELLGLILILLFAILVIYLIVSLHCLYRQKWWLTLLKSVAVALAMVFTTTWTIIGLVVADTFWFH